MRDLSTLEHYPPLEKVTKILCSKTQNANPAFFRLQVCYYFSKVAATMKTNVKTMDRGIIPVNAYIINLSPSGTGKTFSTNILEEDLIGKFRNEFIESTFPDIAEENIAKLAIKRSNKKGTDPDEELELVKKEFTDTGNILFSFDSGTTPALKQLRHKLLMAKAGALNFESDEVASNLLGNREILTTFLELWDQGLVKQKLIKNTSENKRSEEIYGSTPANMLQFGTPAKLFDGAKIEEEFFSMLESGYARRCLFGYTLPNHDTPRLTATEIYDILTDTSNSTYLVTFSAKLAQLADKVNFHKKILINKAISIELLEYRLHCEALATILPDHEEVRKAELIHRHSKALKIAGTYAFIEGSFEITADLLYNAICIVEESGIAFNRILKRDKTFVRLAKYIASINREVTLVDLTEDLPFFKGSEAVKREMITMAIAYGYKNNIIIKRQLTDGIDFLLGECLEETDLEKITIAYSKKLSENYINEQVSFNALHKLTQTNGFHWVNHHLRDGLRKEDNVIQGFNMIVIDVDGTASMDTAKLLLKDYSYLLYTTRSHTPDKHRFRLLFPTSHIIKLCKEDFAKFMDNFYEWLPFDVDKQTNQANRKWLTFAHHYEYNQGISIDARLYIPKTAKAEERKKLIDSQASLNNIERWMLNEASEGNRNNTLIKYGFLLADSGFDVDAIRHKITDLNNKLPKKLSDAELSDTIFKSIGRKAEKENK